MPVYPYGVHSMVCTVERCAVATVNPLLVPSTLPYGLPDFSAIRDEHVMPALQEALRRHKAEIDTIAHDPTTPTAMNTVVALEQSGQISPALWATSIRWQAQTLPMRDYG